MRRQLLDGSDRIEPVTALADSRSLEQHREQVAHLVGCEYGAHDHGLTHQRRVVFQSSRSESPGLFANVSQRSVCTLAEPLPPERELVAW